MSCSMCKRFIINSGIKKIIIRDNKDEYREIDVQELIDRTKFEIQHDLINLYNKVDEEYKEVIFDNDIKIFERFINNKKENYLKDVYKGYQIWQEDDNTHHCGTYGAQQHSPCGKVFDVAFAVVTLGLDEVCRPLNGGIHRLGREYHGYNYHHRRPLARCDAEHKSCSYGQHCRHSMNTGVMLLPEQYLEACKSIAEALYPLAE